MTEARWAQIIAKGSHGLRRGSWFPVVNASDPEAILVDVNGRRVAVSRDAAELSNDRPVMWSIVRADPEDLALAPEAADLGRLYGVCPNCVGRTRLEPDSIELACPSCGYTFNVDWAGAH